MRHPVHIALGAFTGVVVLTAAAPIGRQALIAQTNWREVRALKMGRFHARIDVSSAHTVRLYSQLDTSRLTGEELPPDSLLDYEEPGDGPFDSLPEPAVEIMARITRRRIGHSDSLIKNYDRALVGVIAPHRPACCVVLQNGEGRVHGVRPIFQECDVIVSLIERLQVRFVF